MLPRSIFNTGAACLCFVLMQLSACVNTIHLPERPAEIREVYLLDLGRHTRLAFSLPDGGFVEYGYGEWRWYARMEDSWWRVPAVLFWPTQGTLGRREWPGPPAEARLLDEYDGLNVLELPAEARRVDALVAELARAFDRRSRERVRNNLYGLDFVPYHRPYWLFNNSNHAVKEWLEELGYEVAGFGLFANWKLDQ